jgi:pimeloyl-ACP methyl ester carboxylesterase
MVFEEHAESTSSVTIDGTLVHWVETGRPSNDPPVVALHGLNDCHLTWKRVAPLLGRDRRVLTPDLPGHGLSGRPDASYELRWYARTMARWLDAVGLERVDMVGHSFGGGVAQSMLWECPDRIRRMVLVSSGGLGNEVALSLRLASLPFFVERLGQPFMGPLTKLALQDLRDVIPDGYLRDLSRMNAQEGTARAFARTVRGVIDWRGQRRTFYECAHELDVLPPMALLWGNRDDVIPTAHATALTTFVEGVRLIMFEGCGHYLHHEQPDFFVRAVRSFLDDPSVVPARIRSIEPLGL